MTPTAQAADLSDTVPRIGFLRDAFEQIFQVSFGNFAFNVARPAYTRTDTKKMSPSLLHFGVRVR